MSAFSKIADMSMNAPVLHIVFNPSAAASLREALALAQRDERVIALFDDLSFGPIDPPDLGVRAEWVDQHLGYGGWDQMRGEIDDFWGRALETAGRRLVWTSKRSSQELTGFLEFVWRLDEAPCEVNDLADVVLALLPGKKILESSLLERREVLTNEMREKYRHLWRSARAENSDLRIVDGRGGLTPAPITFFDGEILQAAAGEWQNAARIAHSVLECQWAGGLYQTGDLVIVSRLRALAAAGLLEARGDLAEIQKVEIRRVTELPKRR